VTDLTDRLKKALSDRYALQRELGSGGMATVWLAHDFKHDRDVALKVLRPELAAFLGTERFLAEIRTTARLQHANIVPLFDSGEADGFLYYVMPCIEGESLRTRLDREKRLNVDAMLAIARPVAQALSYAHDHGVVHRDVKPENILLSRGQPFVTDFGIARAVSAAGAERLTGTGIGIGTPTYMSPEQALGEPSVDGRSDIYSLGCVIYEMLSGAPPFTASTVQALLAKRVLGLPPHLTNVPTPVDEVVRKSLAAQPQDRFTTAVALADALLEAAQKAPSADLSVVVLPFENLSPDPDNAFFADGLTEELIADLSKVQALKVISRTSAMHYKGTTKPLPEITRELNVHYVLEGSVRRAANSLRITAQLIDARTDVHLWAEMYDDPLTMENLLQVQREIALRIVAALGAVITPEEREAVSDLSTGDLGAYEYYLRGNQYFNRSFLEEDFRAALRMYDRAIESDSMFARAYAMRSITAARLDFYGRSRGEPLSALAERDMDWATRLAPRLPETSLARGYFHYWGSGQLDEALREFSAVTEQQPSNSEAWAARAFVERRKGDFDSAANDLAMATDLDPRSARLAYHLGITATWLRRYPEAERHYERAISISPEVSTWYQGNGEGKAEMYLAWDGTTVRARETIRRAKQSTELGSSRFNYIDYVLALFDGDVEGALDSLASAPRDVAEFQQQVFAPTDLLYAQAYGMMGLEDQARSHYRAAEGLVTSMVAKDSTDYRLHSALGLIHAGLGDEQRAIREAKRAVDLLPFVADSYQGSFPLLDLARVYAMVGAHDEAAETLEFLLHVPSFVSAPLLKIDPAWAPIREHAGFQALLMEDTDAAETPR
jgi:serine/threonine protein kinase/Flp pilus assembly protein TadD